MKEPELRDKCHVVNGQIRCDECGKRIPTRHPCDFYEPKYPYCPWCGASVTVEAQMVFLRRQYGQA